MIFSILSIGLFVWMLLYPPLVLPAVMASPALYFAIILSGTAVLLSVPFINALLFSPLQKAEQNFGPRLVESFQKDKRLAWATILLLVFPFICYLNVIAFHVFDASLIYLFIGIWVLFLGFSLDLIRIILKWSLGYLNPSNLIKRYTLNAKEAIQNGQNAEMFDWIQALTDISIKAMDNHNSTQLAHSLNALTGTLQSFLESCKSIAHQNRDKKIQGQTNGDEVSYAVFYTVNQLEKIDSKARQLYNESYCSLAITTLGKMTVCAAKLDISLASFPLQIIGKLATKAQENQLDDVAIKASGVLLEVAKSMLNQLDKLNMTYLEIREPFVALICSLEKIAKMTFRKDKTLSISIIVEPLKFLKELMQNEKYALHPDTSAILLEINRVLNEFSIVEQVLRTIPPIPKMEAEEEPTPSNSSDLFPPTVP